MNGDSINQVVIKPDSLYEQDFTLWIDKTVAQLKARNFEQVDLENLIEEIESLGKRDRRELESRLRVLLSHLLKRTYVNSPNNFRGWELTIREHQNELELLLEQSPSLKSYWLERFEKNWGYALSSVQRDYPDVQLPQVCPFPCDVNALLSKTFWQS